MTLDPSFSRHFSAEVRWTQQELIAFECAREALLDMIGVCMGLADELELHPAQAADQLEAIDADRRRLHGQLQQLRLQDHSQIAVIRREYGAWLRAWFEDRLHEPIDDCAGVKGSFAATTQAAINSCKLQQSP